jgi:toxin FitB
MRLIDTNLIIYAAQPSFAYLLPHIATTDSHFATVTKIEVIGFKGLLLPEETFFRRYFTGIKSLPLTNDIVEKAIDIRQTKKVKLGDAIIAATALVHNLELYTHNVADFKSISGLVVIDPVI